jgi:hypothetical protein
MLNSLINFNPNDFVIRISPDVDDKGDWTGELSVGMLTTDDNTMKADDFAHLKMLTDMLIAAIPLMEQDHDVRRKLFKIVDKIDADELEMERPLVEERDGNVVKVNF